MATENYEQLALMRSELALRQQALVPLNTNVQSLCFGEDQHFELRTLASGLPKHLRQSGPKPNPFLPWDQRLEVSAVGKSHALILNKYPVQLGHMLLVTRSWAAQTDWLQPDDWAAISHVDAVTTGLWFFNSGPDAGASQPHRHVQLLPRKTNEAICPRANWFQNAISAECNHNPTSAVAQATRIIRRDPHHPRQSEHLWSLYQSLSQQLELGEPSSESKPRAPYNLLLTSNWMAMVRRRCDGTHGFSVNALGFAGYLLSTERSDLSWLQRNGPEALLNTVVDPFSENTVAQNRETVDR